VSFHEVVNDYGPLVGLAGVALTLGVNGRRGERDRRRSTHARALEAVVAYLQMPYAIRRRRHEREHASAERVRLTDTFREVQAELAFCEALMRTDRDPVVRDAYATLVGRLRADAGGEASRAWEIPPIERDDQMGMQDVHDALSHVREEQERFERTVSDSTRPFIAKVLGR
jgi:hypothetical protein